MFQMFILCHRSIWAISAFQLLGNQTFKIVELSHVVHTILWESELLSSSFFAAIWELCVRVNKKKTTAKYRFFFPGQNIQWSNEDINNKWTQSNIEQIKTKDKRRTRKKALKFGYFLNFTSFRWFFVVVSVDPEFNLESYLSGSAKQAINIQTITNK